MIDGSTPSRTQKYAPVHFLPHCCSSYPLLTLPSNIAHSFKQLIYIILYSTNHHTKEAFFIFFYPKALLKPTKNNLIHFFYIIRPISNTVSSFRQQMQIITDSCFMLRLNDMVTIYFGIHGRSTEIAGFIFLLSYFLNDQIKAISLFLHLSYNPSIINIILNIMNRIFGFFKEKLIEAKQQNQSQLQNIINAIQFEAYSEIKMLTYLQDIKTNYLEWNIMIANQASTGLYYTQIHNKTATLKMMKNRRESEEKKDKFQVVLQQMRKTVKELQSIEKLNYQWTNNMNQLVQKLEEDGKARNAPEIQQHIIQQQENNINQINNVTHVQNEDPTQTASENVEKISENLPIHQQPIQHLAKEGNQQPLS